MKNIFEIIILNRYYKAVKFFGKFVLKRKRTKAPRSGGKSFPLSNYQIMTETKYCFSIDPNIFIKDFMLKS